jgi:hypothetical protein
VSAAYTSIHLVLTALVKVDLIRTVTLPHLEPFGISDGLELKVSQQPVYMIRCLHKRVKNEDKKAGFSSTRWRRGPVPLSRSETGQNYQLCRTWKSQAYTRYRVRQLRFPLCTRALLEFALQQTRSPREPTIFQSHDRGCSLRAQPLHTRHLPLLGRLQRRGERKVCPPFRFPVRLAHHFARSPGYALSLVAETTTSALHSAEAVSQPGVAPEDIALQAARALLSEIERGGCVDQKHQTLVLLMMVLGSEDVGRCRMAEPTERT